MSRLEGGDRVVVLETLLDFACPCLTVIGKVSSILLPHMEEGQSHCVAGGSESCKLQLPVVVERNRWSEV